MSSAGQSLDPIEALAAAQMAGPSGAQQADPIAALAAGQNLPPAPAIPANAPKWDGPSWADPRGQLSAVVRNFTNSMMFNVADPAAAALNAASPSALGGQSNLPTWSQRYHQLLDWSRADTQAGQQAHPYESLAASVAGGVANPVNRLLPVPTSMFGAAGEGAALGTAYGLGSEVGSKDNAQQVAEQAGLGALTGGVAGTAAYGLGRALSGFQRTPEAQLLTDEGVSLTAGQNTGGTAKSLEDSATHIPVLGQAIQGAQRDALSGFNKAAYNRALEPLGVEYPNDAPAGNTGIAKVADLIGGAYDKAYEGASIGKTPEVLGALDTAADEASNLLPQAKVDQIQANIHRLVNSKFDSDGILNSDDLQTAKNFFAEQSRTGPAASLEDRAVAGAYGKVVDALKAGIAQTDPDRGAMLNAADKAYAKFLPIQQAAATNNAGKHAGIFTADQLGNALRSSDQSAHRAMFARGQMGMQDLVQAGQTVLPSSVNDSGTPLRGLMQAAPYLAGLAYANPPAALGVGAALGTGTAAYSKTGQALANALLYGGGPTRQAIGQVPWAVLPGLLAASSASGGK